MKGASVCPKGHGYDISWSSDVRARLERRRSRHDGKAARTRASAFATGAEKQVPFHNTISSSCSPSSSPSSSSFREKDLIGQV